MVKVPMSLINLNGNMLAAVDVETTGLVAGYHEIIQIAVVPLSEQIEPVKGINPFYMNLAPSYPERCDKGSTWIHNLDIAMLVSNCPDQWKAADLFDEWFQKLDLPMKRSLVPLAHNWVFEAGFLQAWLGIESFNQLFHPHPRDSMLFALGLNDAASLQGLSVPFNYVGLDALCKHFGLVREKSHDALNDALATAKVYKSLLEFVRK